MDLMAKLENAQADLKSAASRWDSASAAKRSLEQAITERTVSQRADIVSRRDAVDRHHAEIVRLNAEIDTLSAEIDAVRAGYDAEFQTHYDAQNAAHDDEVRARHTISVTYFEMAQIELSDDDVIEPAALAANIDYVINSRRAIEGLTLGQVIVQKLSDYQTDGGLKQWHVARSRTRAKGRGYVNLTARQSDRVYEYLSEVCIYRGDNGLAPPFRMEINGGENTDV